MTVTRCACGEPTVACRTCLHADHCGDLDCHPRECADAEWAWIETDEHLTHIKENL